jgi:hypothetical protein
MRVQPEAAPTDSFAGGREMKKDEAWERPGESFNIIASGYLLQSFGRTLKFGQSFC